jgi:hypothetical protein
MRDLGPGRERWQWILSAEAKSDMTTAENACHEHWRLRVEGRGLRAEGLGFRV